MPDEYMKKLFYLLVVLAACSLLGLTNGCADKKKSVSAGDSIVVMSHEDSLEALISAMPMPKIADRLFTDFLYNYMSRRDVQYERTIFPIKEYTGNMSKTIEKKDWKRERFFSNQYFYTLLFDSQQQRELLGDTAVSHAVVEKIYLEKGVVKQYVFERLQGAWMLTKIVNTPMESSPNYSFLNFYNGFVNDSVFQSQSLSENLMFSGPDPDDDLSTIEGVLLPEQFPSFAPPMPHGMMYNIMFGDGNKDSDTKIMLIEGISNGSESELVFKRHRGKWLLCNLTM